MSRRVEGSYTTVNEAFNAVDRLRDEGYRRKDIYLVANEETRESIPYTMEAEVTTDEGLKEIEQDEDRTLWEKIKDAFTFDEHDTDSYDNPDEDPLYEYRADIAQGNILVLLEEDDSQTPGGTRDLGEISDDVKATDPPLTEDLNLTRNQIKGPNPELTTNDMNTSPPLHGDVPAEPGIPKESYEEDRE